jgi:hypothetical protein
MDQVLGLIAITFFAAGVIGLSAGVTWLVVKILPAEKDEKPKPEAAEA